MWSGAMMDRIDKIAARHHGTKIRCPAGIDCLGEKGGEMHQGTKIRCPRGPTLLGGGWAALSLRAGGRASGLAAATGAALPQLHLQLPLLPQDVGYNNSATARRIHDLGGKRGGARGNSERAILPPPQPLLAPQELQLLLRVCVLVTGRAEHYCLQCCSLRLRNSSCCSE